MVFFLGLFLNLAKEENTMKQLCFKICQKAKPKLIIQFPFHTEERLIKQMAEAIAKVNKQMGEKDNEKLTNK